LHWVIACNTLWFKGRCARIELYLPMTIDNLTQRLYWLHLFQPITRDKKHIALEIELVHVKAKDKQKYPMVQDNTQMVELESSKLHWILT